MKDAYKMFDSITLSQAFRFMVISNHIPNKKREEDFINYFDGVYPVKQKRLFGDEMDWEAVEETNSIF